jgi:preprotein translocase subunit YajC
MADGVTLKTGDWIVTTEGYVGRVKDIEGDHVSIVVTTDKGSETKRVSASSIHKVQR